MSIEAAQALYGALAERDLEGLAALVHPDFSGTISDGLPIETTGTVTGASTLLNDVSAAVSVHFDVAPEPDGIVHLDDGRLLATGRYRGTARRSGMRLDAMFAHVLSFEGELLKGLDQYTDTHAWRRVLTGNPVCKERQVNLRDARIDDAPRVAALVKASYRRYVDRIGDTPRPMTDDYSAVIVQKQVTIAERDGQLAGVLVLDVNDEGFHIDNVAVHPSDQGAGVGRTLLQHAEREAMRAGFDAIHLHTHELMTENQAIYTHLGYLEFGRRGHGEFHMVHMRKALT